MNLFKKSFALFPFLFLFILGLTFVSNRAEATIAVSVTANNTPNSLTVASGTSVTIRWNATGSSNITCTPPSGYSSAGNGYYGSFIVPNITSTTSFTVSCTAPDVQGSLCPSGSNISEALTLHKLQNGGIIYVPSGGYPHHAYESWVTSGSNITNGATIKVNRTEFIYPNFSGSSLVQEDSCLTFSIPPNTDTAGSDFSTLNVDSGPSSIFSVASSSYGATKTFITGAQISSWLTNPISTVSGTYYGMTQNLYTSTINTTSSYINSSTYNSKNLYVRLTGSTQMYPYSGGSVVTIPIDQTLVIPPGQTTTSYQFYGISNTVSINSAWYY
jgi:hypothetical protein